MHKQDVNALLLFIHQHYDSICLSEQYITRHARNKNILKQRTIILNPDSCFCSLGPIWVFCYWYLNVAQGNLM